MACPLSDECPGPFAQTTDEGSGPSAMSFNQFHYRARSTEGGVPPTKVILEPFCSYLPAHGFTSGPLALQNMCPALRSGGVDCRDAGKCRFLPGQCSATGQRVSTDKAGRCEYDADLLRDTSDVSYLLRSASGSAGARFPARSAGVLMDNWARRMEQQAEAGAPVKVAAAAGAFCMAVGQRTMGTLVLGPASGDYREFVDQFGDDWGPVYWGQARWLTAMMSRPLDDVSGTGGSCIVRQNCDLGGSGGKSGWNDFYCNGMY